MISYTFKYTDLSGGLIRWIAVQYASDDEAISSACKIMPHKYARLEIAAGERLVFCQSLAVA